MRHSLRFPKRSSNRSLVPLVLLVGFSAASFGCEKTGEIVRPKIGELRKQPEWASLDLTQNFQAIAPKAVLETDPPICLPDGTTDPKEAKLGGRASLAAYPFSKQPSIRDMYATVYVKTEICTDATLSSSDQSRLQKLLSALQITKAQSFGTNLTLTGTALGGITYPAIVPFSYASDAGKYKVTTTSLTAIPWQVTTSWNIQWSYTSSTATKIGTAKLFGDLATAISGTGGATNLLSPAANAYLTAANTVAQTVAGALSTSNIEENQHLFDMIEGPDGPTRSVTIRLRDDKNKPLAGVRLVAVLTNSLATLDRIDPLEDDAKHTPKFAAPDEIPAIVTATVAGPSSGSQTLQQQISKNQAYQNLLKSTASTTDASFRNDCKNFENDLKSVYGLNKYDVALTMGYVLSQHTLYLSLDKFYSSGCFADGRVLLKTMGINVFEKKPSQ